MKFDVSKLNEENAYFVLEVGAGVEPIKVQRYLNSGQINFLSDEYVQNYFNGIELKDGTFGKDEIGKGFFNPTMARRQFLINLAELVTDIDFDLETINAFEKFGIFYRIEEVVENSKLPIAYANEIIEGERSVGVVVQYFLEKVLDLIPKEEVVESLTENFAAAINSIDPERLSLLAEVFKSDKNKI